VRREIREARRYAIETHTRLCQQKETRARSALQMQAGGKLENIHE